MDGQRDIQKDTQRQSQLARFFDRHSVRTNPFGANQSADRAYRRSERIVAALFLVTNHIPPTESLRSSVRTQALLILENVLSLRDEMRTTGENVAKTRASIRHLISLVRLLAVSGFVSGQNTNTVVEGLDELANFLTASANSPLSESVSLSHEDLLDIHGGTIKDIKDTRNIKDMTPVKDIRNVSDKVASGGGLSVREQSIFSVLRAGGELGIRDIASNLPEYSEKMIQRELVALVAAGRVKKTGLKRWSRYSIAS